MRGIDAEALEVGEGESTETIVADGGDEGGGDVKAGECGGGGCATAAHVDTDLGIQGELPGLGKAGHGTGDDVGDDVPDTDDFRGCNWGRGHDCEVLNKVGRGKGTWRDIVVVRRVCCNRERQGPCQGIREGTGGDSVQEAVCIISGGR